MKDIQETYSASKPKKDRFGRAFFGRDNDFRVSYVPSSKGTYHVFLFGEIEDAQQFQEAIEVMYVAGEGDVVVIHLSTNGGSVDATDTFIAAMRKCEARVVVEATGGVHSAGTIILMNAPEFRLSQGFNALLHNGSTGAYGKTSDAKVHSKFEFERMDELARQTYRGFLTEEEIAQLIAGKDFIIGPEEWIMRWKERQEYLKLELELAEMDGQEPADELEVIDEIVVDSEEELE